MSGGVVTGGDAILALTRGLEDVGFTTMSEQPIAIRGDRLVLTVRTWHDPHGFDLPLLACMEFGENGRMVANIMFDAEDLDAATVELDRRHAALEAESAPTPRLTAAVSGEKVGVDTGEAAPGLRRNDD